MKLTMTNAQAMERVTVLAQTNEKGKLGYVIARNRRKIEEEIKEYSALRDEAVKKYCTATDEPGRYSVTPEAAAKIDGELSQYSGIEFEADIMTVSPKELYGGGLTSRQMYSLDWMVK